MIADAEATDLAGSYGFTSMRRTLGTWSRTGLDPAAVQTAEQLLTDYAHY
jgi:hypothetical protein